MRKNRKPRRIKCKNHFCHHTFNEDGQKRFCSPNCQQYWNGTGKRRYARGERYKRDPGKPYKPRDFAASMQRKIDLEEFRKEFEIKRNSSRAQPESFGELGGLLGESLAKSEQKPRNLLEIAKANASKRAEIPDLPDLPLEPLGAALGGLPAVASESERQELARLLGVEL